MESIPNPDSEESHSVHTDWDDLATTDLPEILHDGSESRERETTPADYEDFARHYFGELFNDLDDPGINASPADEQAINDQIAVTASLLVLTGQPDDVSFDHPTSVFSHLTEQYQTKAETAANNHNSASVKRNQRFARAIPNMAEHFNSYFDQHHPMPTSPPDNTPALPDNLPDYEII